MPPAAPPRRFGRCLDACERACAPVCVSTLTSIPGAVPDRARQTHTDTCISNPPACSRGHVDAPASIRPRRPRAWHGIAWHGVASHRRPCPATRASRRPARRCAAANTSPAALLGTHAHWNGCPWLVYDRSPRTLPPCDPARRDPRPVSGPASGLRLRQGLASATLFPRGNAALPHSAANVAVYE